MDINVTLAILSAILGGLITLIVTYQNNKTKRFELEYNYRKKLEEKFISNAQNHLEDVYLPLYAKLIYFYNNYTSLINSNDIQKLENEIYELEKFKNSLENEGLTAFLIQEIENQFDQLLDFLLKSKDAEKTRFGILQEYNLLGIKYTSSTELPKWIKPFLPFVFIYIMFNNIASRFFKYQGLSENSMRLFFVASPIGSKYFDAQFSYYLTNIKQKIKEVTLGTK